jgi:hypothetical protein
MRGGEGSSGEGGGCQDLVKGGVGQWGSEGFGG